jgi:archaellin
VITKKLSIVFIAFVLTACATSQAPLDDAYYWPDKESSTAAPAATTSAPKTTGEAIDYINVQDTTVTIRIKR